MFASFYAGGEKSYSGNQSPAGYPLPVSLRLIPVLRGTVSPGVTRRNGWCTQWHRPCPAGFPPLQPVIGGNTPDSGLCFPFRAGDTPATPPKTGVDRPPCPIPPTNRNDFPYRRDVRVSDPPPYRRDVRVFDMRVMVKHHPFFVLPIPDTLSRG